MRRVTRSRWSPLIGLRSACALACAAAAWSAFEADAHAEAKIGIEPRGEVMYRSSDKSVHGGPGLHFDVGYSFDTYPIIVIPEFALAGSFYAPEPFEGSFRTMAGIRVGAALVVEPSVYVRGGYCLMLGRGDPDSAGTFEAGFSLDKRLERSLTLGGSIGYQGIYYGEGLNGAVGGLHVGFWL